MASSYYAIAGAKSVRLASSLPEAIKFFFSDDPHENDRGKRTIK